MLAIRKQQVESLIEFLGSKKRMGGLLRRNEKPQTEVWGLKKSGGGGTCTPYVSIRHGLCHHKCVMPLCTNQLKQRRLEKMTNRLSKGEGNK